MIALKVYDNHFDANEWTVILAIIVGICVIFALPRRFSSSILFFMCGVTFGFFFDHVLSVIPVSFYDVNDNSKFELMDFVSYWMYGPVSYFFFFLYDALKVKIKFSPLYILGFASASTCLEWGTLKAGIFHYQHGYGLGVSFVIYLIVHSIWVGFFYLLKHADAHTRHVG